VDRKNARLAINLRALEALRLLGGAFDAALRDALGKRDRDQDEDPELYGKGFALLAERGEPESFAWLAGEMATAGSDADSMARTKAALRALRAFAKVPGRARFAATRRLIRTFHGANNQLREPGQASRARSPEAAKRAAEEYWEALGDEVLDTLLHLSRDPATGKPALLRGSKLPGSVEDFRRWFELHDDPGAAPWTDG
jgi:hypothetical protein